jgi:hypothetical protein
MRKESWLSSFSLGSNEFDALGSARRGLAYIAGGLGLSEIGSPHIHWFYEAPPIGSMPNYNKR